MLIFHDPVTSLQYCGYSIALAGLVYYKIGGNIFQHAVTEARLSLAELRRNNPAKAKAAICAALVAFSLFVFSWWPTVQEKYKRIF